MLEKKTCLSFCGVDVISETLCGLGLVSEERNVLGDFLDIVYCNKGKICYYKEDMTVEITSDEVVLFLRNEGGCAIRYKAEQYEGTRISILLNRTMEEFSRYLELFHINMDLILQYFTNETHAFRKIICTKPMVRIFRDIQKSAAGKDDLIKLYVLEMLAQPDLLSTQIQPAEAIPDAQTELARQVHDYLRVHLEKHTTIKELADQFHVSIAQLQTSFEGTYGMTVYACGRKMKMEAAAELLGKTNRTVLDIASQFGYSNGSKFAKAFRSVIGVTPHEYRNMKKHI